jgi:cytochrome c-type biogenesis protein CcmF
MFGSILIVLALLFSMAAMTMYFLSFRGYNKTLNYGRMAYHLMAMLVIAASTYLWFVILTHQYQFKYVFSYTSKDLPTGLLFSAFWGGQEGSFMLWLLLTAIVGIFLQAYTSKRGDLEPRVMAVYSLATTFLLIMVSPWFKNPFAYIWTEQVFVNLKSVNQAYLNLPFLQSFLFSDNQTGENFIRISKELYTSLTSAGISVNSFITDGRGLNPQLLNFWMQIHPPILFIGFAMSTVPFAFAIAALMKNDYRDWVRQSFPWVLAGAAVLGLGIMMGGYWAYEMLGWGGYWAWDPVENSSLIPWIVAVACIHTMLVQRKSQSQGGAGKFVKTNLILAIMTYVLVLYSTFLTRSGVLGDASVHSFVDPGMMVYLFLLIFMGAFILLAVGMFVYRWKTLNEEVETDESLMSRELALFTSAVVLCASAIIILFGTSAPLMGTSLEISFYNEMNLPIAIIIGLLNGLSLLLKWRTTSKEELIKRSLTSVALAVVLTVLMAVLGGITDIMMILLGFSAFFTIIVNGEIALKVIRGNVKKIGAYVAHIGIAIFILGVIGSASFSDEVDVNLVKNEPQQAFGYNIMFTGYNTIEDGKKFAFNIDLQKGDSRYQIKPVMYVSEFNNSLMREPSILNMLTKDFYVSPLGYDPGGSGGHSDVVTLKKGGSTEHDGVKFTFNEFVFTDMESMMSGGDFEVGVKLSADYNGTKEEVLLAMRSKNGQKEYTSYELKDPNLIVALQRLDASGVIEIMISHPGETASAVTGKEVLTITASIKPFIGLVWIGVLVMFIGFLVAAARRVKETFA